MAGIVPSLTSRRSAASGKIPVAAAWRMVIIRGILGSLQEGEKLVVAIICTPSYCSKTFYFYIFKFLSNHINHHAFFTTQTATDGNWFLQARMAVRTAKNEAAEQTPTASLKSMVVVAMLLCIHRMKVKVIPYVSCQASAPFQ